MSTPSLSLEDPAGQAWLVSAQVCSGAPCWQGGDAEADRVASQILQGLLLNIATTKSSVEIFFFQCQLASVIFLGERSNQCVDFCWPVNFMGPVPRVFYSIL